jgi:hypothetical protein
MITGPVRGALEGEGRYIRKVYFFQGGQYWRYDLKKDYGEVDYPKPLSAWKLPPEFESGVDACLSGREAYKGKAYFFRDQWYVSYDWKSDRPGQRRLIAQWDRARGFPFPNGIDAALNGQGAYEGKAYFFKGDKYARYDWKSDQFDLVDQKLSAWRLGPGFDSHLTACLKGAEGGLGSNPTAYFFKGDEYVQYDWKENRGLPGYPFPIRAGWPSGCAVWGSHDQAPTFVCEDARLDRGRTRLVYPAGTLNGQAGWQIRVNFASIEKLADKLSRLTIPEYYGDDQAGVGYVPPRRITRLALNAHGLGGIFGANGPNGMAEPKEWITDSKILGNEMKLRTHLERVGGMLAPGAPILLAGCMCAQTKTGGYLLISLSDVFKGHPVTGLTSIGYSGGPHTKRSDDTSCSEPGMRDTSAYRSWRGQKDEDTQVGDNWADLKAWPWASEASPNAKTALNGEIIRRPVYDIMP